MKKTTIATVAAIAAMSACVTVSADDVSVRTSIGSGEVTFKETNEAAKIDNKELTKMVVDAVNALDEADSINGFLDVSLDASLKLEGEEKTAIKAETIDSFEKTGTLEHVSTYYSYSIGNDAGAASVSEKLSGTQEEDSQKFTENNSEGIIDSGSTEMYAWEEDGVRYKAKTDGNGWRVSASGTLSDLAAELGSSLEQGLKDEASTNFALDGLQPNMYEEDGVKYFVCLYDADSILASFDQSEDTAELKGMFEGILKDSGLTATIVINAETGVPRAVSFECPNSTGTIPGDLFGSKTDVEYTTNTLYATLLLDDNVYQIEIPEEVKNAPVEENAFSLDSLLGQLGGIIGGGEAETGSTAETDSSAAASQESDANMLGELLDAIGSLSNN